MKKEDVRMKINAYLDNLLVELNVELSSKLEGSVMQCSDVNDIDSHGHQFQVIKEEASVKDRISELVKMKEYFKSIPDYSMDFVREGALVKIKNQFLYIGVSIPSIEILGNKVIGISKLSPIYSAIENKAKGFKFNFNNVDCEIESIQ